MRVLKLHMLAVYSVAFFVLVGCGGGNLVPDVFDTRQNVGACPPAGSIYDASRSVEFASDTVAFSNITFTGEVSDVRLSCRYADDEPVSVELEIDFAFGKGPAATTNNRDYAYWVAVTRRSGKVLAKKYFNVRADFGSENIAVRTEKLSDILIPRADSSISAANFEVLVGFELTDEQLEFNQTGQRFRLGAGR